MNSLDKIVKKKLQIYHSLKEVSELVGMHYNSCKKRVKILKNGKYKETTEFIKRVGKYYKIHESVIADFMPYRPNSRRKNELSDYKSFTTINPKSKYYSREIFDKFIDTLKNKFPNKKIEYSVEDNKNKGENMHIHVLSDVNNFKLEVQKEIYLFFGEVKVFEQFPQNIFTVLNYIKKANINY